MAHIGEYFRLPDKTLPPKDSPEDVTEPTTPTVINYRYAVVMKVDSWIAPARTAFGEKGFEVTDAELIGDFVVRVMPTDWAEADMIVAGPIHGEDELPPR